VDEAVEERNQGKLPQLADTLTMAALVNLDFKKSSKTYENSDDSSSLSSVQDSDAYSELGIQEQNLSRQALMSNLAGSSLSSIIKKPVDDDEY